MSKWLFSRKKDVYFYSAMFRFYFIGAVLMWLCIPCAANGQLSYSRLEIFGTRDGMLSSKIYSLVQTTDRKLWIGTELGLTVYNGYHFINYPYTLDNETVGRVRCLAEDSLGNLWFGGDKGLFCFKQGQVHKAKFVMTTSIIPDALLTDHSGNLWIGGLQGLFRIEAGNMNKMDGLKASAYPSGRVYSLATDNQSGIYFGTAAGVFTITRGNKNISLIWRNPDTSMPVMSVAAISPDTLAWNCLNQHPVQMIKGKTSSRFTPDYIGRTVFSHAKRCYALTTGGVGELNGGLSRTLAVFGKATNHAVTALIDAEDNIWIGSWEGLIKFRRTGFLVYELPSAAPKETFSFLEKRNGRLLFGSNRGVVFTCQHNKLVPDATYPAFFSLAEVMSLHEDKEGGIWAGSGYQGISRWKHRKLSNWCNTGYLKDNNCRALYPYADGKLLACTENGVTLLDPLLDPPLMAHFPFRKNYTRTPELMGCFQTENSPAWIYGSQGLYRLTGQQLVDDSIAGLLVKDVYINKIIQDKTGSIWIATLGKGLLKCRQINGSLALIKAYDSRNGLPSDIVLTVLADKNNNIWLGDYMSISVIPQQGEAAPIITYNEKDGLLASYYQGLKLEQDRSGRIWGLTSMGTFSFYPDSVSNNVVPPFLELNSMFVNGEEYGFSRQQVTTVEYHRNNISFRYTAISLTDPGKIRYAYRLTGTGSGWINTQSQTVSFNSLAPGTYTFELKACNNSGIWTADILQHTFSILPPFWQTWWFRLSAGIAAAGLIVLFFNRRMAEIKNKAALQQQLRELEGKALRAQMNPHFIFNSLNAIQELIITGNIDHGYQYLSDFSRLLRLVLNNSEKNLVPLSAELEMIRLQLSLESLRFKNSFSYHIETDRLVEPEMTRIPPLLTQPYVENAIWHGLRHKEGEKNVWVRIKEKDGRLHIEIEDNGVGRAVAGAIRKQKLGTQQFESKGSALAQQRIQLLNKQNPGMAEVQITDKLSVNNEPLGTLVTISLPANL